MPDLSLDPSTLSVPLTSLGSSSATAVTAAKNALAAQKAAKPAAVIARLDLESLYTNLKSTIGEYWAEYKEALGLFVLGQLNQNEFQLRIDHFVTGDAVVEHLHNQLLVGVFFNAGRDPPEPGVAPWVSANDKPVLSSKANAGDAAELRLKNEIMALPPRDRRRLKEVTEPDVPDPVPGFVTEYHQGKQFRSTDNVPPNAGGKTNWDLEIRKRYAQPLAAESGEFPDAEVISGRINPICYGEALPDGAAANCAAFMATATEHFIKEVLSAIYSRSRTNIAGGSVNGIVTHRFRRQLQAEEDALARGEIERVAGSGLLPAEMREAEARPGLAMHDLKLAVKMGDVGLGQYPLILARIMNSYEDGEYDAYQVRIRENAAAAATAATDSPSRERQQKGDAAPKLEGTDGAGTMDGLAVFEDGDVAMVTSFADEEDEDDDWGWDGGSAANRAALGDALDACLAIGV